MSRPTLTFGILPPNPPPLDLKTYLPNYLFLRSLQRNWSLNGLVHLPVSRPCFEGKLAGGEHYFEQRVPGHPFPVISICFFVSLAINIEHPIIYSSPSTHFTGTSIFVFFHSIPDVLPLEVEDLIISTSEKFDVDLRDFITFLDFFCEDYHCSISPPLESDTSPLEE
jgi:hypothetical protein